MSQDSVVGMCPICRRNVYFMESHYVDFGIDYHRSCYIKHLCIVKNKLDKKKTKGNITMDDAYELQDTEQILLRVMYDKEEVYHKERKYDTLVCKPDIRESFLRSNLKNNMKLLEESRSQRWAFEALNLIDNIFYISAPDEKKQLSEGELNGTMQTPILSNA